MNYSFKKCWWSKETIRTDSDLSSDLLQVILESFRGDPSADEVYQRLLNLVKVEKVLSAQTVLSLLEQLKCFNPELGSVLENLGNKTCPKPKGKLTWAEWKWEVLNHGYWKDTKMTKRFRQILLNLEWMYKETDLFTHSSCIRSSVV